MATSKLKVYELAKELGLESQNLVDSIQRLGIDIKNTMSVLGSEEVRTVREYYRKNRPLAKSVAAGTPAKTPVTEKRVGATVIRRRSKASEPAVEAPVAEVAIEAPEIASEETLSEEPAKVAAQANVEEASGSPEAPAVEAAPEEKMAAEAPEEVPEPEKLEKFAPEPMLPPPPTVIMSTDNSKSIEVERKPRRFYPSIIKKVSTDQHLVETVGPKLERKDRPKPASTGTAVGGLRPKTPLTPAAAAAAASAALKQRVKEVETAQAEAAKEAGKRRMAQRQDSVFRSTDYLKRELIHATKKKKNAINRPAMKTQLTKPAEHKRVVEMADTITVAELAKDLGVKVTALVSKLMSLGVTATINQAVDYDTATLAAAEFGFEIKQKVFKEEDFVPTLDLSQDKLKSRAPVVTIMGHVDHGKTSLLDAIRKTKVAAGEAGGITQHVGAYTVQIPKGKITFVDTPGHEAFTAMRARGAKVTDIVVVVVSAVDGVMPQTLESISHAKAANVPIIVAINKVDLPDGNPDRIKQTLAGQGLNPEEWGGDTIYAPVSAKTGQGIDALLESILLQSEMLELKANYDTPARGTVVESRLDKAKGPIASVLIQHGKLKPGDLVVCGNFYGKVRAMTDSAGQRVIEALPSDPVEILGLPGVPAVGDDLFAVADEKTARELTTARIDKLRATLPGARGKVTLEEMMASVGSDKELKLILKADVQGSAEALREALTKFPTDKVKLKVLHAGTGGITESDVMLAAASQAVVLGFNIRPEVKALKVAEVEGVQVRTYTIIYDLLEDVKKFLEGLLDKEIKEKVIGRAEVREIFSVPKIGVIAGSAVIDGKVIRGCHLRLLRDSRVVYEGKISSLRRFKEDVKEVTSGFECGIGLENFNDLKLGDQFEAFLKEELKGSL